MNKYCMIIKVKPEFMKDYVELHKNAWPELLKAIDQSGAKELIIFKWGNFSIVFFECFDLDDFYRVYGKTEVAKKWNALSVPWFDESPNLDGTEDVKDLEKIFDFREQLVKLH